MLWHKIQGAAGVSSDPGYYGERGINAGGLSGGTVQYKIDYYAIATTGNATTFGDLVRYAVYASSCSGFGRGVHAGGSPGSNNAPVNVIDYITIATTGNSVDFGDLVQARRLGTGVSDGIRGVFSGCDTSNDISAVTLQMDYITIATTGNATVFGNMIDIVDNDSEIDYSACSNGTRGVFAGGATNSNATDTIQYITIATTGDSVDFGDLSVARMRSGSVSDTSRGLFAGGGATYKAPVNVIDYITIATTGNATDFGDLTGVREYISAAGNGTRATFTGGGYIDDEDAYITSSNTIDYVTISTTGNATDFGDLTGLFTYHVAYSGN